MCFIYLLARARKANGEGIASSMLTQIVSLCRKRLLKHGSVKPGCNFPSK